jgi:hypothetical protein
MLASPGGVVRKRLGRPGAEPQKDRTHPRQAHRPWTIEAAPVLLHSPASLKTMVSAVLFERQLFDVEAANFCGVLGHSILGDKVWKGLTV